MLTSSITLTCENRRMSCLSTCTVPKRMLQSCKLFRIPKSSPLPHDITSIGGLPHFFVCFFPLVFVCVSCRKPLQRIGDQEALGRSCFAPPKRHSDPSVLSPLRLYRKNSDSEEDQLLPSFVATHRFDQSVRQSAETLKDESFIAKFSELLITKRDQVLRNQNYV